MSYALGIGGVSIGPATESQGDNVKENQNENT